MLDSIPEALTLNAVDFRMLQLFPTPVAVAPVNEAGPLNDALRECILQHRGTCDSVDRSNDGGWQSADDFASWSGVAGAQLLEVARRLADQLTSVQTDAGLKRLAPVWKINAWANVNESGDANHAHHHPASYWSGVYWVDAGGTGTQGGQFEMMDPRGILPCFLAPQLHYAVSGCLSAGLSEFLVPCAGTMIMFPSWLVHAVRRYRGKGSRISIAFNFSP